MTPPPTFQLKDIYHLIYGIDLYSVVGNMQSLHNFQQKNVVRYAFNHINICKHEVEGGWCRNGLENVGGRG